MLSHCIEFNYHLLAYFIFFCQGLEIENLLLDIQIAREETETGTETGTEGRLTPVVEVMVVLISADEVVGEIEIGRHRLRKPPGSGCPESKTENPTSTSGLLMVRVVIKLMLPDGC